MKLRHIIKVNRQHLKDYFRKLGLACVIGSLSSVFLNPKQHVTIAITILFILGICFSCYGLYVEEYNDK